MLVGKESQHVKSYDHNKLEVFGAGSAENESFWKSVVRQSLLNEFIEKDIENVGVFKVTSKGEAFMEKPHAIELSKDHEYVPGQDEEESENVKLDTKAYDNTLFEILVALRKKLAKQKDIPPYVIFQEPSLEEMATVYPTTKQELAQINGVGMGKVAKFGKPFMEAIGKYVEENDIVTASDVVIKSSAKRSKLKIFIIQQIDRKIDLEEIAESQSLPVEKLISEIENICYSGTKLNLDYYIDHVLDDDRQDDIYDYFLSTDTDDMTEAMDELGEDYSEEEVRLMRIKFMSEYAN